MLTLFGALLLWKGADLVHTNFDLEATTLPITMSWVYLPIVIIGAAMALQALIELSELAKGKPAPLQIDGAPIE